MEKRTDKAADKKALRSEYADRAVVGGVYAIRNTENGKMLVDATNDIKGIRNRFEFMKKSGSCFHLKLQKDWGGAAAANGSAGTPPDPPFVFEALAELEKTKTQTDPEFKADLLALKALWLEEHADQPLY